MTTTMDEIEAPASPAADLSAVLIPLLKGVTYRADDAARWSALLQLQGRVRDHVAVLGLELMLDEAEGYAFLRSRPDPEDEAAPRLPRLVPRRPLQQGLAELVAYLSLAAEPGRAVIDDSVEEQVDWLSRSGQHKTATLPRVIFSR